MRLKIQESYQGEFAALTPDERDRKLYKAVDLAVAEMGEDFSKALAAASTRGGEHQVVEDLTQIMAKAYRERMGKLAQAIKDRISEA